MSDSIDPDFFDRADAIIQLANDQINSVSPGKVSASLMYAATRFNAFVTAAEFDTADKLQSAKQEIIEYFVEQYEVMLKENLDDYVAPG
jgi:hypothetical protein